jgi:hypothetical protein
LAQAPVTLQEQLNAQCNTSWPRSPAAEPMVVEAGTVLAVQKAGVQSMPFNAIPKCPAKFENNNLHMATGFFCAGSMALHNYFQQGSKVYPVKIEVNPDKGKVTFHVVSCDECNGINPPTGQKGEVEFEFPKGYLQKASAGEVEDTIGQVFSIATNDDQQAQGGAAADQQPPASSSNPRKPHNNRNRRRFSWDDHRSSAGGFRQAGKNLQSGHETDLHLQRHQDHVSGRESFGCAVSLVE